MKAKLLTIFLPCMLITTQAIAESSSFSGAYVGAELSSSSQKFSIPGSELGYNTDEHYTGSGSRAVGVGVIGGYAFDYGNNLVGIIEGKIRTSSNKTTDELGEQISKENFRLTTHYLQGFQIANALPYIKIGFEVGSFKFNNTSTITYNNYQIENFAALGISYGAGIKYKLTQNISLGLDYSQVTLKGKNNIKLKGNTFALNASYHF